MSRRLASVACLALSARADAGPRRARGGPAPVRARPGLRARGGARSEAAPAPTLLPESDLRDASKTILVMTTASVPWLTGTAINPLLRAAHLAAARPPGAVTLYAAERENRRRDGPASVTGVRRQHAKRCAKCHMLDERSGAAEK